MIDSVTSATPMYSTLQSRLLATALAILSFSPGEALADAIVRTQAMLAGTIAEYSIDAGRVRVDLEISAADLPAFVNLLPDAIYEELGHAPRPFSERVEIFFANDLAISADDGEPLPGRLLEIGPQPRVRRDDITGEPLGDDPEAPSEPAVLARLEYALEGRPKTLSLYGLRTGKSAAVGFVAYHLGVAVNDFRYLTPTQTLTLDWQDPWYTHFERRTLRRQYFAPMSGFIYVEPYEVRKEIILRPIDLQRFVDLGLEGREVIPADLQPQITRAIGEFLRDHHPVTIDGVEVPPELARVNFLERTLRTSRVVEPGTDLGVYSATVGAIFVYATDGLPQQVTMDWDLWDERITRVPVSAVDQAGGLPDILEPNRSELVWTNFLKHPRMPGLEILAEPPSPLARSMRLVRWALLVGLLAVIVIAIPARQSRTAASRWIGVVLLAFLTAGAFAWAQRAKLSQEEASAIVSGLLTNIYRAFDYRDEERIYDTLAASTDGSVLEQTYLDTRKGLELQSQGGARAKVAAVELVDLALTPAESGGFQAHTTWNVAGAIGHWGHVHQRKNQYEAELSVAPIDGAWKLIGLEIVREERQ
jgi:hypothetical protein